MNISRVILPLFSTQADRCLVFKLQLISPPTISLLIAFGVVKHDYHTGEMNNFASLFCFTCIHIYIQFVFYFRGYILVGLMLLTSVECTRLLNTGLLLVDHANEKHEEDCQKL